jgi:hypothetical protein
MVVACPARPSPSPAGEAAHHGNVRTHRPPSREPVLQRKHSRAHIVFHTQNTLLGSTSTMVFQNMLFPDGSYPPACAELRPLLVLARVFGCQDLSVDLELEQCPSPLPPCPTSIQCRVVQSMCDLFLGSKYPSPSKFMLF